MPRPTVSVLGVAAAVLVFDVVVGAGATWWRISNGLAELGASGAFSYVFFVVTAAKRLGEVLARFIGCGVALPLLARRLDRTDRGALIATSMTYGALALSVPFVCVPALVSGPVFVGEVAARATSSRVRGWTIALGWICALVAASEIGSELGDRAAWLVVDHVSLF